MSTGSGKLYLPLSKTDVEIREAFLVPQPGKALPSMWVRLTGVPRDLLEMDRLMAAMVMVGKPLEVDELSLRKWTTEPIRMRFQCRYPERIKGTIQVFVNGVPFNVGVSAELGGRGHGTAGDDGAPRPPAPPRDDDGDDDYEDHSTGDYNKHGWKGSGKDKEKAADVSLLQGGGTGRSHAQRKEGASSAPQMSRGMAGIGDQYGSNLGALPFPSLALGATGRVITTAEDADGQALKKALAGDLEEISLVSGDTVSMVEDPVDAWVLSSLAGKDRPPLSTEPMALADREAVVEGPQ
jgi:hypothetical protein